MNQTLISLLSALPALAAGTPTVAFPTTTFSAIKGEMSACGSGQHDLSTGFKKVYGRDLQDTDVLTPGIIDRSAPNYGAHWVFQRARKWQTLEARRGFSRAAVILARAVRGLTDKPSPSFDAMIAVAERFASGELSADAAQQALGAANRGQDSDPYFKHLLENGLNTGVGNHPAALSHLLDMNREDAQLAYGAALLLVNGEDFEAPAMKVFSGQRLKHGELIYEITFDGTRPVLTFIPYQRPENGQQWKDGAGNKYLILVGAEQAVNLKTGTLLPLDGEGQIPDTVRGVTWTRA